MVISEAYKYFGWNVIYFVNATKINMIKKKKPVVSHDGFIQIYLL